MNDSGISKHDQVLAGLVLSLQAAALQHLGKITNPLSGKVERDLDQARGHIDLLEMLKAKCRHETPEEILNLLDKAVMELQMNYLDELKKDEADGEADDAPEAAAPEAPAADAAAEEATGSTPPQDGPEE